MATTAEKREAFRRLCEKRVERTLKDLSLVGNLGGSGYESTAAERAAVKDALAAGLAGALQRLENAKTEGPKFSLPA